jgi:hypothetical protein
LHRPSAARIHCGRIPILCSLESMGIRIDGSGVFRTRPDRGVFRGGRERRNHRRKRLSKPTTPGCQTTLTRRALNKRVI